MPLIRGVQSQGCYIEEPASSSIILGRCAQGRTGRGVSLNTLVKAHGRLLEAIPIVCIPWQQGPDSQGRGSWPMLACLRSVQWACVADAELLPKRGVCRCGARSRFESAMRSRSWSGRRHPTGTKCPRTMQGSKGGLLMGRCPRGWGSRRPSKQPCSVAALHRRRSYVTLMPMHA